MNRVKAGDEITAALFNELIAMVESRGIVRAGHGINVTDGPAGITVAVSRMLAEHVRLAVIEAHTGETTDLADNIRYTVKEYGTENRMLGVAPTWGRPTKRGDVEIQAARVGSYCWIFRQPAPNGRTEAKLWIPAGGTDGETLAFFECGEEPGGGVGAAVRERPFVPPMDGAPIGPDPEDPNDGGPDTGTGGGGPSPVNPPTES